MLLDEQNQLELIQIFLLKQINPNFMNIYSFFPSPEQFIVEKTHYHLSLISY
jgi:hypothetical protein